MSPDTKRLLLIAGGFLAIFTGALGVTGAYVYRTGMIDVHVQELQENGDDIHIMIPGALVLGALACVPDQAFADLECPEEAEVVFPMLRTMLKGLADSPDFVMVEVEDGDETVLVRKKGNHLVVDVESSSERVHATVPLRMVQSVMNRIEKVAVKSWEVGRAA